MGLLPEQNSGKSAQGTRFIVEGLLLGVAHGFLHHTLLSPGPLGGIEKGLKQIELEIVQAVGSYDLSTVALPRRLSHVATTEETYIFNQGSPPPTHEM